MAGHRGAVTKHPPGNRKAHDTFCCHDMWTLVRDAKGGAVQHHRTYEFPLPDGRTLRTRISRPVDTTDYGPTMWSQILREQLEVSARQFWDCVHDKTRPGRSSESVVVPDKEPIPFGVAEKLMRLVGLSPEQIGGMSRAEAVARLNQYWSDET